VNVTEYYGVHGHSKINVPCGTRRWNPQLSLGASGRLSQTSMPFVTRELEVSRAENQRSDQTRSLESGSACEGSTARLSWGQGLGESRTPIQAGPEGIERVKHRKRAECQQIVSESSRPLQPSIVYQTGSKAPRLPRTCHAVKWIPPLMSIAMEATEVAWRASRAAEMAFQQISIEADNRRAAVAVAFAMRIIASARATRVSLRQLFSCQAKREVESLRATLQVIDTYIGRGRRSLRRSHSERPKKWMSKRTMLDCLQRKGVWLQLAFKIRVGVLSNGCAPLHTQIKDLSLNFQPALQFQLWEMHRERHQPNKMYMFSTVPLRLPSGSLCFTTYHSSPWCRRRTADASISQEARGFPYICLRPRSLCVNVSKLIDASKKSMNSFAEKDHVLSVLPLFPQFASKAQIQHGCVSDVFPMSDYSAQPNRITCTDSSTGNSFDIDVQGDCLSSWTDIEKIIFLDKFLQYPKNFNRIASFLRRKRVRDCIRLYYDSKHHINFKAVLREHQQRRRGKLTCWEATRCAVQVFGGELEYVHGDNTTWFRLPSFDHFFTGAARHQIEAGFSSATQFH